jgi:hypothetical protein
MSYRPIRGTLGGVLLLLSSGETTLADTVSPQAQAAFEYLKESYTRHETYAIDTLDAQGADICKIKVTNGELVSGRVQSSSEIMFSLSEIGLTSIESDRSKVNPWSTISWSMISTKKVAERHFVDNRWREWDYLNGDMLFFHHGTPAILQKAFYRLAESCGAKRYIFE